MSVTLPQKGNLVLDHRYFLGNLQDYSGNGNEATVGSGSPYFQKNPDKHIKIEGADRLIVSDSPELQATDLTIIPYGDFDKYNVDDRIVSKRDGGGIMWELYFDSETAINFVASAATINWSGSKSVAMSLTSGGTPKFYKDGAFVSNGSATVTLTPNDAVISIGNLFVGNRPLASPIKGVLIYNTVLTDAEIAQAHEWVMAQISPTLPKKNFVWGSQLTGREPNVRSAWSMENIGQKIIDKTGGGVNGNIVGATQTSLNGIPALQFDGSSHYVDLGTGFDVSGKSVSLLVKPDAFSTYNTLWTSNAGSSQRAGIQFSAAGNLYASVYNGSVYASKNSGALEAGQIYHVVAVFSDYDTEPTLYVDGVAQTNDSALGGLNTSGHFIGSKEGSTQFLDGAIGEVIEYDSALTQADVTELYEKYARLHIFVDDFKDANVSIAAEGGAVGDYLSNTQWRFGDTSGRFKISSDTVFSDPYAKVIECTTAGLLYQEFNQGVPGTYKVKMYKGGNVPTFMFIASVIGSRTATGQEGYSVRYTTDNAVIVAQENTSIISSATSYMSDDEWYELTITIDNEGDFAAYILGGSEFLSITEIGTGSNTAYSSGKYMVFDIDPGDKIADLEFYPGVLNPI